MLTNKKLFRNHIRLLLMTLALTWTAGCTPPGPRALLEGKRLVEQGKYAPAVEQLKIATSLLSTNAQAWNYLGLACHHAGQPASAADAYQKALKLNHDLIIVHYNYGCLLLEQNKLDSARNELTAFTLHQGNSLDGWLKLGTAHLRLQELGAAETSFKEALRLSPQNPEALNDLGIIENQRGRYRDAATYFDAATKQQPNYGPALLNLAVVSQFYLNNRPLALQRYHEFLSLSPRPPNWDAVNATARQLDQELNPPSQPQRPPPSIPVVAVNPVTNVVRPPTNPPARPVAVAATNVARPVVAAATNVTKPDTKPDTRTSAPVVVASTPVRPPPVPVIESVPVIRPDVVKLPDAPVVRVAENSIPSRHVAQQPADADPIITARSSDYVEQSKVEKKSFLSRMNPANAFRRDPKSAQTATPLPVTGAYPGGSVSTNPGEVSKLGSSSVQTPSMARYSYALPSRPANGNRVLAEASYSQGVQAQRERRFSDAVGLYRTAIQSDPGYFEAQLNLGLASYELGELPQSLLAYETALAINPASFNARFNFALALKKAGYIQDSAQELERLLAMTGAAEPADHLAMAHLTLANLYSGDFHRPAFAKPHYLKVLELDPGSSQATSIRYWLQDNP
ncbi:MAG: Tetratricopeptide 2 repeat protein [Pedosphaera sp.]|nr:Tetratricopeptide 2 repeat protein [Pedosphaera sp.]